MNYTEAIEYITSKDNFGIHKLKWVDNASFNIKQAQGAKLKNTIIFEKTNFNKFFLSFKREHIPHTIQPRVNIIK